MKFNSTLLEHYVISTLTAGVAIWQTGNHHLKSVAWGAIVAVLGPVGVGAYNHFKSATNTPTK